MRNESQKIALLLSVAAFLLPAFSHAQCAMCRAVLENSGESEKGQAVNDGIVYLMAIPYILVGVLGYFIYRLYTKKKA